MKKIIVALILALAMMLPSCAGEDTTNEPTDTTTEAQTTVPDNTTPQPTEVTLNIGSYNAAHFSKVDFDYSVFANDINSKKLDIVGLQEVDCKTTRSKGHDQPKLLAQALGWEYYEFAKAIDYQGGGYGHCIVSKYPIKSFTVHDLPGGGENRVFGHAVIDVNGVEINFINTHLSYEETDWRVKQFAFIAAYVKKLDNFIITGDFNTTDFTEYEVIPNATLVNNAKRSVLTFPAGGLTKSIDNIVVSPMFTLGRPKVLNNTHSDHVMLFTTVTYTLPKADA